MSTTIFCTFDQQDLADLAMGKIKDTVSGIKNIEYVVDYDSVTSGVDKAPGFLFNFGIFAASTYTSANVKPSRPVTVKITCDVYSGEIVVSHLMNMHAYNIVMQ